MYFLKTATPLRVLISRTWGLCRVLAPGAAYGDRKAELLFDPFLFLCLWSCLEGGNRKASEDSLFLSREPSYSCAGFWSLSALWPSKALTPWSLRWDFLWVGGSERSVLSVGCSLLSQLKSVCGWRVSLNIFLYQVLWLSEIFKLLN